MTNADRGLEDIQDLNFSYLLLVQRLLRKDRATAMFRLKLSEGMADLLVTLTSKQLTQLARINQLLCRPVFDEAECLSRVLGNSRELDLVEIHSSLLLSSIGSGDTGGRAGPGHV